MNGIIKQVGGYEMKNKIVIPIAIGIVCLTIGFFMAGFLIGDYMVNNGINNKIAKENKNIEGKEDINTISSNKIPNGVRSEFWEWIQPCYMAVDDVMNCKTIDELDKIEASYPKQEDDLTEEDLKNLPVFYAENDIEEKILETFYENYYEIRTDYYLIIINYHEGDKISVEDKVKMKELKKEYNNNLKELKKENNVNILK